MKSIFKKLRRLVKKEQEEGQSRIDVLDEQHHNKMMILQPTRDQECRTQQHHLNIVLADQKQSFTSVSCDTSLDGQSTQFSSDAGDSAVSTSSARRRTTNKNMWTTARALASGKTKEYYYRAASPDKIQHSMGDDNDDEEESAESEDTTREEFTSSSSLHNHYKPSQWGNHIQTLKARGLLIQEHNHELYRPPP